MTKHYENVYMALRGSMIDRDMGDKEEDAVLIDMGASHIALKKAIPSSAILIAYSMLYYPGWMKEGYKEGLNPISKKVEEFDGGVNNPKFKMFFNIQMVMIAAAVGSYAGLWTLKYSKMLHTTMITPNLEHPVVQETRRRINEGSTFKDARDTFIELMKNDDYAIKIPLADDYIANAKFVPLATAAVDEDYIAETKHLDLSQQFEGADE